MLLKKVAGHPLNDAIGMFNGIILGSLMWAGIIGGVVLLTGCTTTSQYEICDTPNCGDNVAVIVE